ncbi:MAG TPA: biopolymer transporter ExbD, partial [Firmicutes bacterium]|nr:biopolymer transporter ExbD [Bacillota bacterium]
MILEPPRRRAPQIQLTPLVDVVFNLLVFFIVFTVFRGSESAIALRLPRAATAEQAPQTPIVVTVPASGGFYVGNTPLTREALDRVLAQQLADDPERAVIIKADRSVRYERLVEALDAVRQNGGSRI